MAEVDRTKVIPGLRRVSCNFSNIHQRKYDACTFASGRLRRDKHETSAGCFINANILLPIRRDHSRVRTFPLVNRSNLFFRPDNSERNMAVGCRRVSVNTALQLIRRIQLDDRVNYRPAYAFAERFAKEMKAGPVNFNSLLAVSLTVVAGK